MGGPPKQITGGKSRDLMQLTVSIDAAKLVVDGLPGWWADVSGRPRHLLHFVVEATNACSSAATEHRSASQRFPAQRASKLLVCIGA